MYCRALIRFGDVFRRNGRSQGAAGEVADAESAKVKFPFMMVEGGF
jgi:hypothetical protein